jgi:hypothetical protein
MKKETREGAPASIGLAVLAKNKKPGKTRKINLRQRKFLKGKIEGKSSAQAARDAGYAESTAMRADEQIASKPAVRGAFKKLMEAAGITDELLARRLKEGIDAKETKFFQKDGLVISKRTVVYHGERRSHLELALKLKGRLIDKHELTGKDGGAIETNGRIRIEFVPRRPDSGHGSDSGVV